MWFAIFLTLTASAAISVGKVCTKSLHTALQSEDKGNSDLVLCQVLQKDATRNLPRFSLRLKVVKEHLHSRAWVLGLSLDLGGAILMVAAYALAPVSKLLRPVRSLRLYSTGC